MVYTPKGSPTGRLGQYTCSGISFQPGGNQPISIPELEGLTYQFNPTIQTPVWGIPQERFWSLTDGQRPLPFEVRYASYVSFLDFHSFNDIFTRPMSFGDGIQNLKEIGQRVVHPASFILAPVAFGTEVQQGSFFKNGEISLELRGLSVVDGTPCALVAYDAGESTLKMIIQGPDGRRNVTDGGSLYRGDIYIDLATRWVRKATLDEYQISQSNLGDAAPCAAEYTVRHIILSSNERHTTGA